MNLIIEPDEGLLVAVGRYVKTAVNAAPCSVGVQPLTAFYQLFTCGQTGYGAAF